MKKHIVLINIFIVYFLTSCSQAVDYSILDEKTVDNLTSVAAYVDELQASNTDYKGFKVFDTSDGKKVVVISSGEPNRTLRVNQVEQSSKDTSITVVEVDLPSEQKNSYVVVRLDEIVGAFYVFEKVQYEGNDN